MAEQLAYIASADEADAYIIRQNLTAQLGTEIQVSPQSGGFANFVYRIRNEGTSFYLKQRASFMKSRPDIPRERQGILDELRAYEMISEFVSQIIIPEIIHIDRENYLFISKQVVEGDNSSLTELMESGTYPISLAESVGNMVGRLHGVTLNRKLTVRPEAQEWDFYQRQYMWMVESLDYPDTSTRDKAIATVRRLKTGKKSLIWGDLSPKNIITSENIIGLVDLETIAMGDSAFDLGYLNGHILLHGLKSEKIKDAVAFVLEVNRAYKEAMSLYTDFPFIEEVIRDAVVFAGTAMIHRTFAALIPEASQQGDEINKRVMGYATNLINTGKWQL